LRSYFIWYLVLITLFWGVSAIIETVTFAVLSAATSVDKEQGSAMAWGQATRSIPSIPMAVVGGFMLHHWDLNRIFLGALGPMLLSTLWAVVKGVGIQTDNSAAEE
jgi:predicted MFS family arabinose efflux permease